MFSLKVPYPVNNPQRLRFTGCYKLSRDDIVTGLRTNCNKAKQVLQAGYQCTETECITNCIEASWLPLCPKSALLIDD